MTKNQFLDKARKILLACSLVLLILPGFKGMDLHIAHFSLGRFQPFKFFFIFWMIAQGMWVYKNGYLSFRLKTLPLSHLSAFVSFGFFYLFLFLGIWTEGGGQRAWNIYTSLVLGGISCLITAADKKFPLRITKYSLALATLLLFLFALLERYYFQSDFVQNILNQIKDGDLYSAQAGSTLTASALAEFCLRTLPLFIASGFTSIGNGVVYFVLIFLILLSMTRGTLLATLVLLGAHFALRPLSIKNRKKTFLTFATLTSLALVWMGPDKLYGRFVGWISPAKNETYAIAAQKSANERWLLAKGAITVIETKPWFGIGLDGFCYRLSNKIPPLAKNTLIPHHTHNLYLEIAVSGGLIALAALIGLMLSALGMKKPVLSLYILGQSISMLFDSRIYVSWLAITFFWFAGICYHFDFKSKNRR